MIDIDLSYISTYLQFMLGFNIAYNNIENIRKLIENSRFLEINDLRGIINKAESNLLNNNLDARSKVYVENRTINTFQPIKDKISELSNDLENNINTIKSDFNSVFYLNNIFCLFILAIFPLLLPFNCSNHILYVLLDLFSILIIFIGIIDAKKFNKICILVCIIVFCILMIFSILFYFFSDPVKHEYTLKFATYIFLLILPLLPISLQFLKLRSFKKKHQIKLKGEIDNLNRAIYDLDLVKEVVSDLKNSQEEKVLIETKLSNIK